MNVQQRKMNDPGLSRLPLSILSAHPEEEVILHVRGTIMGRCAAAAAAAASMD